MDPLHARVPARGRENALILTLFLAALGWHVGMASVGWSHAISDLHGWRQAQTAIIAYFMQQGGPWIAYEMPLLGPPWRLPHEFGLYQLVMVAVSAMTGLTLEAAGRATSLAFFYATLGVCWLLMSWLGVASWNRLLVLAFWLVSPHYIFWSRTIMVESTTLFLCALYLLLALHAVSHSRRHWLAFGAVASGALGAAVKPITVVPFVMMVSVCWLHAWWKRPRTFSTILVGASLIALPLAGGWAWQMYADSLKALNPLASGMNSSLLRRQWILGPPGSWAALEVRAEPVAWRDLLSTRIPDTLGHVGIPVLALVGLALARRRVAVCLVLVAAAALHIIVFMPLHLAHPYYFYAVGGFLIMAVGLAAVSLRECEDWRRHLAWALTAAVAASCVSTYTRDVLPVQRSDAYRRPAWFVRLAREIASRTRPDDVIVVFGMSWDPQLPYYAKRRALMWPGWADASPGAPDVSRAVASLAGHSIGAVVSCSRQMPDDTLALFRQLGGISAENPWSMSAPTPLDKGQGQCTVFFRGSVGGT